MADLEEMALKRDRGFLVRLGLLLTAALVAGALLYGQLTGDNTVGCVARTIGGGDGETVGPAPR